MGVIMGVGYAGPEWVWPKADKKIILSNSNAH